MEKLGYEVWDTGVKTVNAVNVKALPRAYQPIFNNEGEPLNKKAGSRGQMSVTQVRMREERSDELRSTFIRYQRQPSQRLCLTFLLPTSPLFLTPTMQPSMRLAMLIAAPLLSEAERCAEAGGGPGHDGAGGYRRPRVRDGDPHRDWPRKLCLEG